MARPICTCATTSRTRTCSGSTTARGTFRAVPRLAVRNTSNSSMAVDFSDVDRDGNVDILVVDMLGRGPRRKTQVPTHTPLPKLVGQIDDRPQWQRNTLL